MRVDTMRGSGQWGRNNALLDIDNMNGLASDSGYTTGKEKRHVEEIVQGIAEVQL